MACSHVDSSQAVTSVLRYGELAIVLYSAPDLPYPERRRLSPQELAALAVQGTDRLGGADRVRDLRTEMLLANRALMRGRLDAASYDGRVAALLERAAPGRAADLGRYNRCLAYDYGRLQAA